ncbi:MAG: pilus assembly protein PilM [Clostridia bacterium]|nr:pilus assembly protein PilM [Clostridia bacterium]
MLIKRVVGVEITDKFIRGVELLGTDKSHKIISVGIVDLPADAVVDGVILNVEKVSETIASLWNTAGFKTNEVYYGVDNKYVLVRFADIKAPVDKNFDSAVIAQAQNFLPVDQRTVEMDYVPLNSEIDSDGNSLTKTLIVAAGKKMIGDCCDAFKKCGLKLQDIEVNNIVMSRLLPIESEEDRGILLINFKKEMMNLLIIKDNKPLLARNINIDTNEAINENLFVQKYLESIGKDIVSSLAYYNSSTEEFIERVFISGYGVWNEEMVNFIKETAKTNVIAINPFKHSNNKGEYPEVSRPFEFAIAYSLALRGLESDK